MRIRLNELRGRMADRGTPVSLQDIENATGISRNTLTEISKGRVRRLIPEYIDALCLFFGVDTGELLEAESVKLPLRLNIRPDRRGVHIGQRTRQQPTHAQRTNEADFTMLASEEVLAREWNTPEEDEAWADL
jgi:DNA-binding Xre family transcriptional regulator